jgi:glycosyltransferase involved in cell wall biosynthesis
LGYLEREEVIKYMTNAKILVMVRSNNLEAQASFPSKLPEYLACAKPVIAVNVGEISHYVSNGKNIFLVEPNNVDALANKIDFVLANYNLAEAVGRKGKELANTIFNYNYQAKRMLEFVDKLK